MLKIQKEDKELLENVRKTYEELKETAWSLNGKSDDHGVTFIPDYGDVYLFFLRVDAFCKAVYDLEQGKFNFNHNGVITHIEYMYLESIKSAAVDLKILLCSIPLNNIETLKVAINHITRNSIFLIYPGSIINKVVSNGLKRYEEAFSTESVETTTTKKIEGVKNGRSKK